MNEREQHLESSLLSLRDPLARVELAASRISRAESGRITGILADGICDAVADLDRRIQESLRIVRRPRSVAGTSGDCCDELRALVRQLEPVFAARARQLQGIVLPGASVRLDPRVARRGALLLLRCAGDWAGPGGWLRVELLAPGERVGLRVEAGCGESGGAADDEPFCDAARFALAEGARFEQAPSDRSATRTRATLWFPCAEATR